MELREIKGDARLWFMLIFSIIFSIFCAVPISGQRVGDPAKVVMQEMTRRELQLKGVGGDKGHPNDPKRSQALMDQVSEDFQRILILHNDIVRALVENRTLSYKFISDAASEIKKRATRLQSSLKLQKPESATANRVTGTALEAMQTKDELLLLCKQIENFVRNPIIEKPGTIDAEQLGNARKDLQSVVEISDAIKKQADKLKP